MTAMRVKRLRISMDSKAWLDLFCFFVKEREVRCGGYFLFVLFGLSFWVWTFVFVVCFWFWWYLSLLLVVFLFKSSLVCSNLFEAFVWYTSVSYYALLGFVWDITRLFSALFVWFFSLVFGYAWWGRWSNPAKWPVARRPLPSFQGHTSSAKTPPERTSQDGKGGVAFAVQSQSLAPWGLPVRFFGIKGKSLR